MKKVGICTLYDANPNFGATLQAFALQEIVKSLGYDVEFLRFKNSKNQKHLFSNLKLGDFHTHSRFEPVDTRNITINRGIKNSSKYLNICDDLYNKTLHSYDSIIIGSDELWNLNNPSFTHRKEYYGYNLSSNNIFAYAPSSNGTTKEDFINYFNNSVSLENINSLSARDTSTHKFISDLHNIDVPIVCDPTLLIENFDKYAIIPDTDDDYILVYDYNTRPDRKKKIKEFAKEKNLKIYSIGFYNAWADKNIDADIFEFLGYVKKAKYIFSASFHGVMFSLIFKKQFVAAASNCKKIEHALEKFELTDRDISNVEKISSITKTPIDYDKIEKIKLDYRDSSMNYLINALNGDK